MTIAHDTDSDGFRKSSYSNTSNSCVEVKDLAGGARVVRSSRRPEQGTIHFDADEWDKFVAGVKAGEFD